MTVRTRFAPSPTGYLHIGGARTALYSWLHARKHGGVFVLRIEDTDLERSSIESVNAILEGMTWLGLEYDEGPFYQTQRFDRYREVIQQLLAGGHAYRCYCSREELDAMREAQMARKEKPKYDGRCRSRTEPRPGVEPVIRFRNPDEGAVVFDDLIRGQVSFSNQELDDLIIARSDGTPTYNLTVVVDDMDMGISHVIRGDDHINNTPRQINILRALGQRLPTYAHVPMILGGDGKRLSKRHGAVSVMQYREDGFLPEALLNYLVRLGWSAGDQEVFSIDDMIRLFTVDDVNKAASSFNQEKLLWLNQQYIKSCDPAHIAHHLSWHLGREGIDPSQGPDILQVIKLHQERVQTLRELVLAIRYFYLDFTTYEEKAAAKNFKPETAVILRDLAGRLASLQSWAAEPIHQVIDQVAQAHAVGMGKVAQPLRVAVTGTGVSPAIDATVALLGWERTQRRLTAAIEYIEKLGKG